MVKWHGLDEEKAKMIPASGEAMQRHRGKNMIVFEIRVAHYCWGRKKHKAFNFPFQK